MVLSRGRRCLPALLCMLLCMLLTGRLLPMYAAGAESSDKLLYQEYIYYSISDSGEVTIKSARASVTEAVIPEEIDGCPVTEIESYAFRDCTKLQTLSLPDSIRRIGDYAFLNCKSLTALSIPDTVEDIGWGIVNGTPWLSAQTTEFVTAGQGILLAYKGTSRQATVPEGVRVIGGCAFSGCDTVETVTLPDSLTVIDAFAFDKCQNLRQVTIPSGVTAIGEYAFHWCTALETVDMPDSIATVEPHAFSYCKALRQVRLSAALQQLSSAVFSDCVSLCSIEIPESIRTIYSCAFQGCTALTEMDLPASVSEIGAGAFDGCTALEKLTLRNPACRIYDDAATLGDAAVICSEIHSTAFIYAEKYDRSFCALGLLRGDYDGDGNIHLGDAYHILILSSRFCLGEVPELSEQQQYAADYDQDGRITMQDAYAVLILSSRIASGDKQALEEAV